MQVGCLGEIIFEVSDKVIRTFNKATWSGSVTIQTHSRHLDNALQEFVGIDPDKFTLTIMLSKHLGVEPMDDIVKIFNYERNGIAIPLTIGNKSYGKYKWLIKNHKVTLERHDGVGNLIGATVDVNLEEYLKE